jgi:hypothetical protein
MLSADMDMLALFSCLCYSPEHRSPDHASTKTSYSWFRIYDSCSLALFPPSAEIDLAQYVFRGEPAVPSVIQVALCLTLAHTRLRLN